MNMIKEFVPDETNVKKVGQHFVLDNAWRARVVELVGVKPGTETKVKWKKGVWQGAPLVHASTPHAKVMAVVHLQVGRARRNRFVISDGKVWADVYGKDNDRSYWKRCWQSNQEGPWRMVTLVKARPLTYSARLVISAAIEGFMTSDKNIKVNLEG